MNPLSLWSRAACLAAIVCPGAAGAQPGDYDARARQIVSQMSLDEKIAQMHGTQTKQQFRVVVRLLRLGIPDLLVTNGPAGFGPAGPGHQGPATALPAPISLAATWDIDAAKQCGAIGAGEAADYGNTFFESPDVNIARIPQNGRTFEAYGEDPFLSARLAAAYIQAVQAQGIIANVKHFIANDQETGRRTENSEVDERTLREIYLAPFEAAVKEGGVASVMGAYNKLNGTYCCENPWLLNQVLKKEWGFDGFVSSDFGAVHSTAPSVLNGLDLEMPGGKYLGDPLKQAVQAGQVPAAAVDEHLIRRFRTMMKIGIWDHPPVRKPIPEKENGEAARRIAEEGCVLLRNQGGLLPLKPGAFKTVALIGRYAMTASTGGGGSSKVNPVYTVPPLDGLQKRLGSAVIVTLTNGSDIAAATAAAKAADFAIVMVGDSQAEGRDHELALAGNQDALIEAVAAANLRTIVVVKSGGPVLMPWSDKVAAILEAWYPGEEDGNVVSAVLTGDYNPSGKLPITFPKQVSDTFASNPEQYPGVNEEVHYSEGVLVGYRWYDAKKVEPLFPFGYGLSYTTFKYSNLKLSADHLAGAAPTLTADFDISNTGPVAGTEVAQVYLGLPSLPNVPQPPRQLKGFARVTINPGARANISIALDPRAFAHWDTASHGWKIAHGTYTIGIGASSRDIRLTGKVDSVEEIDLKPSLPGSY